MHSKIESLANPEDMWRSQPFGEYALILEEVRQLHAAIAVYRSLAQRLLEERTRRGN